MTAHSSSSHKFQSTPSAWRVTNLMSDYGYLLEFQSTPSAWRVTNIWHDTNLAICISIHTLRVEGDGRCYPWDAQS